MAIPVSVGASVGYTFQFESAYGVVATGDYITGEAFRLDGLNGQEPLEDDPTLGSGREPSDPFRGAFDVNAVIEVPMDKRVFGYYLKNMLGSAQPAVTLGARGYIEFTTQPTNGQTITLDGTVHTFVSAGAAGEETDIGANLQATIDALASNLNGSADGNISAATYSRLGNRLVISHDTADSSGNAFTLATNVTGAKVSKATLYGGGLFSHEFRSDTILTLNDIKSLTVQVDDPGLASGNRYIVADGIWFGQMEYTRSRTGVPHATFTGRGRSSEPGAASVAGTPSTPAVEGFAQKNGVLLLDDVVVDAVLSMDFSYSQGMLVRETVTEDGKIEAVDPGKIVAGITVESILSDNALKRAADSESTVTAKIGYLDKVTGAEIILDFGELHVPVPNVTYSGQEYTTVSYEMRAAKGATRSLTATVISDVASYV